MMTFLIVLISFPSFLVGFVWEIITDGFLFGRQEADRRLDKWSVYFNKKHKSPY